jgi:hypothetical protein
MGQGVFGIEAASNTISENHPKISPLQKQPGLQLFYPIQKYDPKIHRLI